MGYDGVLFSQHPPVKEGWKAPTIPHTWAESSEGCSFQTVQCAKRSPLFPAGHEEIHHVLPGVCAAQGGSRQAVCKVQLCGQSLSLIPCAGLGFWHGLSHRSPNKAAEPCSQDKCPDPTEAAGGGPLMDDGGRISQLPSNLRPGNKLLCHRCSRRPCRPPSRRAFSLHPTLLCQPGNTASGSQGRERRGGMRGATRSVLSPRPASAAGLPP